MYCVKWIESCGRSGGRASRLQVAATLSVVVAALAVAGCSGQPSGWSGLQNPPQPNPNPTPTAPSGDVLGTGSVRVAMLLPMSASGNAGKLARVFRNSAELALSDYSGTDIQIVIKDTAGTSDGARSAALSAASENAQMILGPIFSSSVSGVSGASRQAGIPVVAYSTNTSVASRGVYLMSFLPQQDVNRIISYAVEKGRKSFAALLPDNGYGTVTEGAFRQAVAQYGGRVVALERYRLDKADMRAKAAVVAAAARQADAVFMPDGGDAAALLAQAMVSAGVNSGTVKFLGSGQWDDPRVLGSSALAGAWFPAPDKSGYTSFAARYAEKFGGTPPRTATLAYDSAILAAGLVRNNRTDPFAYETLTTSQGFIGIDGVFRFRSDGTNQRGLAVYEVSGGTARILSSAPRTFASGS